VKSPEHIVLVATDRYDPDESNKSEAVTPADNGGEPPAPEQRVIVGLAIWKLEAGSKRVGNFQNESGPHETGFLRYVLTISKGHIQTFLRIGIETRTQKAGERLLLWQRSRGKVRSLVAIERSILLKISQILSCSFNGGENRCPSKLLETCTWWQPHNVGNDAG
jgi:hypothetical protein